MQERIMQKSVLLRALQQEIRRHNFDYFMDEPPSIAQGGRGAVVPGEDVDAAKSLVSLFILRGQGSVENR